MVLSSSSEIQHPIDPHNALSLGSHEEQPGWGGDAGAIGRNLPWPPLPCVAQVGFVRRVTHTQVSCSVASAPGIVFFAQKHFFEGWCWWRRGLETLCSRCSVTPGHLTDGEASELSDICPLLVYRKGLSLTVVMHVPTVLPNWISLHPESARSRTPRGCDLGLLLCPSGPQLPLC